MNGTSIFANIVKINKDQRDKIQSQVSDYLAKGGSIEKVGETQIKVKKKYNERYDK